MSKYATCPFCGKTHRDTAKYCPETGKLLAPTSPTTVKDQDKTPPIAVSPAKDVTGQLEPLITLHDRFSIIKKVGEGGMAAVYQAADLRLPGQVWALKEMSESWIPDPEDRAKAIRSFEREALLLAKLNHQNLPRVIDAFSENGRQYLVMEYVEGETLEKILAKRSAPFSGAEVMHWALQLCDVLSYLHTLPDPVIFRDLKPSNIMIDSTGRIKLIDFGIVRFFKPGQAKDTMAIGTQGYCAVEAISGQTDARSDLYSLCVVLHEMLTRHNPTTTMFNLPLIRKLNPSVSQELERIIHRGLARDRNARWPSVKAFSEQLTRTQVIAAQTVVAPEAYQSPPTVVEKTYRVEPLPTIKSSRPTARLVAVAAQLSTRQVAVAVGIITIGVIAGFWFLAPLLVEISVIWDNVPIAAIVAPFVFAAVPRKWFASISHAVIAAAGGVTLYFRFGMEDEYLIGLLIGVLASAVFIEVWLRFLDRIRGSRGKEAWVRELVWFCVMAMIATGILYELTLESGMNLWLWLGAAFLAVLGWFVGDSVKEYLNIRRSRGK